MKAKDTDNTSLPIQEVRREIDRVDQELLSLIAQRLELAGAVRRAKSGVQVWRPSREDSHVRDLSDAARGASANLVSRIWAELMSASLVLQGPMCLHVSIAGEAEHVRSLVRDRFGASLPVKSYPTASAALAAAYNEPEGVAIVAAPGGMNNWWVALCSGGAMPDMHILAGLPRVNDEDWPQAVAIGTGDLQASGHDMSLLAVHHETDIFKDIPDARLRAEAGAYRLFSLPHYIDSNDISFQKIRSRDVHAKLIGALPHPLKVSL